MDKNDRLVAKKHQRILIGIFLYLFSMQDIVMTFQVTTSFNTYYTEGIRPRENAVRVEQSINLSKKLGRTCKTTNLCAVNKVWVRIGEAEAIIFS